MITAPDGQKIDADSQSQETYNLMMAKYHIDNKGDAMERKQEVLIFNRNGAIVFQGETILTNLGTDHEAGCPIADCKLEDGIIVSVWKIDGLWQGWL